MCMHMLIEMCTDMCTDTCAGRCVPMCIGMCADVHADMNMCVSTPVGSHAQRRVLRYVHVCRCGCTQTRVPLRPSPYPFGSLYWLYIGLSGLSGMSGEAVVLSTGTPITARRICRRRCRYVVMTPLRPSPYPGARERDSGAAARGSRGPAGCPPACTPR